MKKIKPLHIALIIISGIVIAGMFIAIYLVNYKKDYRTGIEKQFQIVIPKEWECLYFNSGTLGGFDGTGTAYYVFDVTKPDEEFFFDFSDERNEDFNAAIIEIKETAFDNYKPIDPKYLYVLTEPYDWFEKKVDGNNGNSVLMMMCQSQKLYVFARYR